MAGLYSHTTRATGTTLTANIYNTDHQNHINNHTPDQMDDYSSSAGQMQTTTDPYPGASESLATSMAGELERIRFVLKQITGEAQWYIDPDDTIAGLKSSVDAVAASVPPDDTNNIIAMRLFQQ